MSEVQYFKLRGEINTECNRWLKGIYIPEFNERKAFLESNFPGFKFKFKGTRQYHKQPYAIEGDSNRPKCFKRSYLTYKVFYSDLRTVGGEEVFKRFEEFEYEYQPSMIMIRIQSKFLKSTSMFYISSFSLNHFSKTWYLRVEIDAMRDVDNYPSYLIPVHPIHYHSQLNMAKRLNMFVLLES